METPRTPSFICPRCHYTTDDKSNYLKHLRKTSPCPVFYDNVPRREAIIALDTDKPFKCPSCDKAFWYASGLSRHKTDHHRNTSDANDANVGSTGNNIRIDNLTVQIIPFGSEDISHIENNDDLLGKYIKDIAKGIPDIVGEIFFNDEKPENQTVRMGREKYPAEMMTRTVDGNNNVVWQGAERNGVLDKLVDKGTRILIRYHDRIYEKQKHDNTRMPEQRQEDEDIADFRREKFAAITTKKKGTYAPIRNNVLIKARDHYAKHATR